MWKWNYARNSLFRTGQWKWWQSWKYFFKFLGLNRNYFRVLCWYFVGSSPSFWFCHLLLLSYFLDALCSPVTTPVRSPPSPPGCRYFPNFLCRNSIAERITFMFTLWSSFHTFLFLSYVHLVRSLSSVWVWCPCSCVRTSSPGWGGNSGAGRAPDLGKIKTYYPDNTHTGCFFTGTPPKSSKKVNLGEVMCIRPIYINVDSPNLGFPYFNFSGGTSEKNHPLSNMVPVERWIAE